MHVYTINRSSVLLTHLSINRHLLFSEREERNSPFLFSLPFPLSANSFDEPFT